MERTPWYTTQVLLERTYILDWRILCDHDWMCEPGNDRTVHPKSRIIKSLIHSRSWRLRGFLIRYVEFYDGYILPADKVEVFSNSDLHPEHKNITISVSQSRIPKIGQEKVKYIVYRKEFDTEFERATKRGIVVCRKSDYIKNHEHYGKYILVDVIRPEIMWGTIEEIESDIKGIILDCLHEDKLIDFLRDWLV